MQRSNEFGIVIPVLFEMQNALPLIEEIFSRSIRGLKVLVVVVDASVELRPDLPESLREQEVDIDVVALPSRFGQHRAIQIGLRRLAVREVDAVVMDSDGQDSAWAAETIWRESSTSGKTTIGVRRAYGDGLSKKISGLAFSWLLRLISDIPHNPRMSSLSAVPSKDLPAILNSFVGKRHYLHSILLSGREFGFFEYERRPRLAGKSGYSFGRRIKHAVEGMVWWSTRPLWVALGLGFSGLVVSVSFSVAVLVAFLQRETPAGWLSTLIPLTLGNSLVLLLLGTLGLYLERLIIQIDEKSR